MSFAPRLTSLGRAYLLTVIALGFLVIGESLLQLYRAPIGSQWLLLAILTLISGSASVELPGANVSISISEAFVFTAVLLYGPAAGTLTVALDGLVISFWIAKRRPEIHRALFNIAAPAFSAWCSAQLFFQLSGIAPLSEQPLQSAALNQILPSLAVFAVVYFGLNSWLIALVIAFQRNANPFSVWRNGFIWLSLNYFCGASVAFLLVGYNQTIDLRFVGVVVPLLLVLYFTFKTSMQRVEDANSHVKQLNSLYLSTIETLAMAIDAKDQVTHGHIRRVQAHTTSLARELGVRDDRLLKAIEAAALLHDMGKLAVPEYILNKPGKLTAAEFDRMKRHATVGADILSAIDFPYPVVPIVRHHHECWDGTGYPDGLKGTDIPIGARILAVVDCFDALTSDRPYRPRLNDAEALRILVERRGTMYDPLIVDTFIRVHKTIDVEPVASSLPPQALKELGSSRTSASHPAQSTDLEEIAASSEEMRSPYELARSLAGTVNMSDAGDVIAKHLQRLIPSALIIFYAYDQAMDELEAKHAVGDAASIVRGMRIPLGERLSGWVAANRQTIVNSDPALDLGDMARSSSRPLRSCLSTPLVEADQLVGVLTVYSTNVDTFTADHRRTVDLIAKQAARTLRLAADVDNSIPPDPVSDLPDIRQLEHFVESAAYTRFRDRPEFSLLFIDAEGLEQISRLRGRSIGDDALRHVVRQARTALRIDDTLFRSGNSEFVALLKEADQETAVTVADRIRRSVHENVFVLDHISIAVDVNVTTVPTVAQGQSLRDLIEVARIRGRKPTPNPARPVVR